ncbi:hypothetical protein [Austwickia chelonae]|uniref:Uncharacterized protein n=1 Tax=Austwickia chelonae NBRC 105200 TaxID=1184607 RepID=K6VR42_9MICO|nr:hypothetical protein [Austwickia chelonae]GAB79219.1 hypothetical protein AUCHE_21_00450 [Austwickia chelonae NBRC 105200]
MTLVELMSAPAVPLGPATPARRLTELAVSGGLAVRLRVAAHPNTDQETLDLLARDPESAVRDIALRRIGLT